MKHFFLSIFMFSSVILFAQKQDTASVNRFIDQWHQDAANVDREAYFGKIDEDGIYIGTDATEVWTRREFYNWAEPQFTGKGTAWDFKAIERNIYFGEKSKYVWFDELLSFGKDGILRGSGVLIWRKEGWKIMHYVLSLPVPNESFGDVMKAIRSKKKENNQ